MLMVNLQNVLLKWIYKTKIKDLSKAELLSFIYNNMDINLSTEVGCAVFWKKKIT